MLGKNKQLWCIQHYKAHEQEGSFCDEFLGKPHASNEDGSGTQV